MRFIYKKGEEIYFYLIDTYFYNEYLRPPYKSRCSFIICTIMYPNWWYAIH